MVLIIYDATHTDSLIYSVDALPKAPYAMQASHGGQKQKDAHILARCQARQHRCRILDQQLHPACHIILWGSLKANIKQIVENVSYMTMPLKVLRICQKCSDNGWAAIGGYLSNCEVSFRRQKVAKSESQCRV